mmetsp:Transcript_8656/g.12148  ORF Transcript_8656/g.12148 Transcript_8656/m.12148 type:complete len:288 (+) Transcript_8656:3-866(+)
MTFNKLFWVPSFLAILLVPLLTISGSWNTAILWWIFSGAVYVVGGWVFIYLVVLYDSKFLFADMTLWERMRRIYVIVPFLFLLCTGMTFWQATAVLEGFLYNDIPFATTPKQGNGTNKANEDELQAMADADDDEGEDDEYDDAQGDHKEFHYDGWDTSALQDQHTFVKRRKPGFLSKTLPYWAPFVEILLGCYWLLVPLFSNQRSTALGIPIMLSSFGFWWVALPGLRTSLGKLVKRIKEVCKSCCPEKEEKKDETKEGDISGTLDHSAFGDNSTSSSPDDDVHGDV